MKRWVVIVTSAYAVLWLALAYPVTWLCFVFDWWLLEERGDISVSGLFSENTLWGIFGAMVLCQAALALTPVGPVERRPRARRNLVWPVAAITFLAANLVFWTVASLLVLVTDQDTVFDPVDAITTSIQTTVEQGLFHRVTGASISLDSGWYLAGAVLLMISVFWMVWAGIFYRVYRPGDGEGMLRRWWHGLLKGSVLELLVALPTHIAIRSKEECCAPLVSFLGIVTGLSIMLMCFGPGVWFLYRDRARRLKARDISDS